MNNEAKRLIIYAPSVSVTQGGGCVLLKALLDLRSEFKLECFLNEAVKFPDYTASYFGSSLAERMRAEKALLKSAQPTDIVLCFGNLPPLFKLQASSVIVFIQNRHIIETSSNHYSWRARLRFFLMQSWLKLRANLATEFWVQTPSMKLALSKILKKNKVVLAPFANNAESYSRKLSVKLANKLYDFCYVAGLDKHKQHCLLIDAWCLLADEGLRPSLCLTVDPVQDTEIYNYIETKKQAHQLKLTNLGVLSHEAVFDLYAQSGALIFPSREESFGLPLLEARQQGLAILAPELDYVRDLIDPEESFDPHSALSIARAVKRYLNKPESTLDILSPRDFLEKATGSR